MRVSNSFVGTLSFGASTIRLPSLREHRCALPVEMALGTIFIVAQFWNAETWAQKCYHTNANSENDATELFGDYSEQIEIHPLLPQNIAQILYNIIRMYPNVYVIFVCVTSPLCPLKCTFKYLCKFANHNCNYVAIWSRYNVSIFRDYCNCISSKNIVLGKRIHIIPLTFQTNLKILITEMVRYLVPTDIFRNIRNWCHLSYRCFNKFHQILRNLILKHFQFGVSKYDRTDVHVMCIHTVPCISESSDAGSMWCRVPRRWWHDRIGSVVPHQSVSQLLHWLFNSLWENITKTWFLILLIASK